MFPSKAEFIPATRAYDTRIKKKIKKYIQNTAAHKKKEKMGIAYTILSAGGLATELVEEEFMYQIMNYTFRTLFVLISLTIGLIIYTRVVLGIRTFNDAEMKVLEVYKHGLGYLLDIFLDLIVLILEFFVDFIEGIAEGMVSVLANFNFPGIKIKKIINPF